MHPLTPLTPSATRLNPKIWSGERPKVLLADDHSMIAEGLRNLLEPECEVVALVSNGYELLQTACALRPDVVVVDITMPLLNGIDAIRQLTGSLPETLAIVLTMHADRAYLAEAFDAGAVGFVVKHAAADELWEAINAALMGNAYISPLVGRQGAIVDKQSDHLQDSREYFRLTSRQRQVVQLIAEGHSVKEIAARLKVAPKTVEFHKYKIMTGLGLKNTAQLIQFAISHGLIA
jgi:DNA-binding NarL/FixJ family response regulator